MALDYLLKKWREDPVFTALQERYPGPHARHVTGMEGSQRSFFIAAYHVDGYSSSLVLTADMPRAEKIYEEVKSFLPAEDVFLFPAKDFFYTGEVLTRSKEIPQQRIKVLERLALGEKILVVAPVAAILNKLIPAKLWKGSFIRFQPGAAIEWKGLFRRLIEMGYERTDLVETEGAFCVRGDIIDIFPFHTSWPLRVSFFDEEVESIRCYDPETQRSLETISGLTVYPAREAILSSLAAGLGKKNLRTELEQFSAKLKKSDRKEAAERLRTGVENHLITLENEGIFEEIEQYITYFYPEPASLLDYYPSEGVIFWDEPETTITAADSLRKELEEYQTGLLLQGEILPGQTDVCWNLKDLFLRNYMQILALNTFAGRLSMIEATGVFQIQARPIPSFMGRFDLFNEEVQGWWKEGYEIYLICETAQRRTEMERLLLEHGLNVHISEKEESCGNTQKTLTIVPGTLENGSLFPSLNLVFLVDKDILPRRRKQKTWKRTGARNALRDFQELAAGDLVIHDQHGIGRYMGMRSMNVDGVIRDYLYIKYAGEDKLYLPVEQMDALQRYTGGEGRPPKIYALGGQEWTRVKNRVRSSVQELAKELLSLYAAREAVKGFAFSPDHPWQKDFEDRFIYEETPDQLRAIEEVKQDMEKSVPMDRLLCGDVGYGKTEVAVRAAFKAVMDGKQIAFLVPTTILAQQHYENLKERFHGFPVKVDLLSRFRGAKEQKDLIKSLKAGVVDIVIGTHRLISKDIGFKDLGLLIIDEEHRFGVRHKEKLKMLRQNVDVLSMTATPIPRTMHMALSGARDLSIIDTPPENRYPVQTYVAEYSYNMIKEAIQRELHRGGQVYFIYNRIQTIGEWADKLQELVPEARIAVGHGQMPEHKLEQIMHDFMHAKYDLLVCTTIVEAGLDIPNVNTMVIYDADFFGLAQLYQLRGRVGRSNRLAYCYLTYRKDKIMTEDAIKRLQAIKEFTRLGSGFKIALRDMEIRGAGNILGPEQHGFIMAVGYELYCSLLEQAIDTMKGSGEPLSKDAAPRIDLQINAFLPSGYIPDQRQKIEIYRRIAILEDKEELKDMINELKDRYGRLQPPVENLLRVVRVKQLAREKQIDSIERQKDQTRVRFHPDKNIEGEKLWELVSHHRRDLSLHAGKQLSLHLKHPFQDEKKYLKFIIRILEEIN